MAKILYIDKYESLPEIVRSMESIIQKEIIFVVPKEARLFKEKNLHDLKIKADLLDKKITIISLDRDGLKKAAEAGIGVSRQKDGNYEDTILNHSLSHKKKHHRQHHNILKSIKSWLVRSKNVASLFNRLGGAKVGILVLLIIGGGVWYFSTVKTFIYVKINPEEFKSDLNIFIDSSALSQRDEDTKIIIPGQLITKNLSSTETFSATGEKTLGSKSQGKVTFYNFTEDHVTFKDKDLILIANGLRFKLQLDSLRIRPTAHLGLDNKKIDPTSLMSPQNIEAENVGEEFNLPADTTFEITGPKFNISSKYFFAKNNEPISGGYKKQLRILSESDIKYGSEILSDKIRSQSLNHLERFLKKGEKLVQDKVEVKILDQKVAPTLWSETADFKLTLTATVVGLAYDRVLLEKIIKKKIDEILPAGSSFTTNISPINLILQQINLDEGNAQLINKFKGKIFYDLDNSNIKYILRGKSEEKLKTYLASQKNIIVDRIEFSPSWLRQTAWLSRNIIIKKLE